MKMIHSETSNCGRRNLSAWRTLRKETFWETEFWGFSSVEWNSDICHTFISIIDYFYKHVRCLLSEFSYVSKSFSVVWKLLSIIICGPAINFNILIMKICTNLYRASKICYLYRADSVLAKRRKICTNTVKSVLAATLVRIYLYGDQRNASALHWLLVPSMSRLRLIVIMRS